MSDDRRNIKVKPNRFDELKKDKPADVSWGYYLVEIRTIPNE